MIPLRELGNLNIIKPLDRTVSVTSLSYFYRVVNFTVNQNAISQFNWWPLICQALLFVIYTHYVLHHVICPLGEIAYFTCKWPTSPSAKVSSFFPPAWEQCWTTHSLSVDHVRRETNVGQNVTEGHLFISFQLCIHCYFLSQSPLLSWQFRQ